MADIISVQFFGNGISDCFGWRNNIMADTVDRIEKNLSALSSLLGKDNVEDMKKQIANLIVKRVEDDINSYDYYLFYPSDYKDTIGEAFETTEKKIVKLYKDAMLESAQEAVK